MDLAHVEHQDEEEALLICDPRLVNEPDNIVLGILAHEFAHIYLEHPDRGGLEDEKEADKLAFQWGFAEEIKALLSKYREPTDFPKKDKRGGIMPQLISLENSYAPTPYPSSPLLQ